MNELLKKPLTLIENRLQIDATYFARGSFFAIVQQAVGVLSGLTVFYLIGHFVSREAFGEYSLVLSIIGMLTFISLPGMDTALISSAAHGFDSSYKRSVRMKFLFSLISMPLLVGWAFIRFESSIIFPLLIIVAFAFPFLNAFTSYPSFLVAKKRFDLHAKFAAVSSIFYVAIFLVVVTTGASSFNLLLGYLTAMIIPYLIFSYLCLRLVKNHHRIDTGLIPYGLFLTAVNTLPWIVGNAGSVLLGTLIGISELAVYTIAAKFLTSVEKNLIVLHKPITAKLAGQSKTEHLKTVHQHGLKFIIAGFILSFIAFIITPYFYNFFFPQYPDSIIFAKYMSLALIPLPIQWVLSDIIVYQKQKQLYIFSSTIPDLIKLPLYFVFIPFWGIGGFIALTLIERFLLPIFSYSLLVFYSKKNILTTN